MKKLSYFEKREVVKHLIDARCHIEKAWMLARGTVPVVQSKTIEGCQRKLRREINKWIWVETRDVILTTDHRNTSKRLEYWYEDIMKRFFESEAKDGTSI